MHEPNHEFDQGASRRATDVWSIAPHALFALLMAFNVFRILHHAMWRDELQAFMIAADSPTLTDVFHQLHYESHPGLWHILLWLITRFTTNPASMQIVQAAIAVGLWLLIYRCSPFNLTEKFLLLASYFLFWEYFVLSRSYSLMALSGLGYVALRTHRPRHVILPWLLLGLLANTAVYGTIWSVAMATFLCFEQKRNTPRSCLIGAAAYSIFLAIAVLTMAPAPDAAVHPSAFRLDASQLISSLAAPVGAFAPLRAAWLNETYAFLKHPQTAPFPNFRNPNPVWTLVRLLDLGPDHPFILVMLLVAPIAACWLMIRDRALVAEFAIAYVGVLLFAYLWDFPGVARHHGVLFLMLIASMWMSRVRDPRRTRRSRLWTALLVVNAIAGLMTLFSELRPFSQGRNVAAWLRQNSPDDAFLLGSRDTPTSTVAGYLRRPIYYLECECLGTFIVWNTRRQAHFPPAELGRRLVRALDGSTRRDAILILNRELPPEAEASATPRLSFALVQSFQGAIVARENYFLYRVALQSVGEPAAPTPG